MKLILVISIVCLGITSSCKSQQSQTSNLKPQTIKPAAERISVYLPLIKGKRVGIFANHTSTVGKSHLVDTLMKLGVNVVVAFGPEHGFRGDMPDGVKISDYKDEKNRGQSNITLWY